MVRHGDTVAVHVVVPMHAKQVAGIRRVLVDAFSDGCINRAWVSKLGKRRQHHVAFTTTRHAVSKSSLVDDVVSKAELVLHCCIAGCLRGAHDGHLYILSNGWWHDYPEPQLRRRSPMAEARRLGRRQ